MAAGTVTESCFASADLSCAGMRPHSKNSVQAAIQTFMFEIVAPLIPASATARSQNDSAAKTQDTGFSSCIITSLKNVAPDAFVRGRSLRSRGGRMRPPPRATRPRSGGGLPQAEIGIIGGSGLYSMPGLSKVREVRVKTPFGATSDAYVCGVLEGRKVAFLARHGRGHRILPSELNFRANIHGFKQLGVERIVSMSAVGSLKEEHKPLEFVIPDQFFDRTRHRVDTFFGGGVVAHISFADPICPQLAATVEGASKKAGVVATRGGTYLCMEGPQFSTKAESNVYREWGMDVIGITNLQEAKLAREAELCYVTVAMVTDYDCWHQHHDSVTVDQIVAVLVKNAENAAKVVRESVVATPHKPSGKCESALAHAILTDKKKIPAATKKKLKLILGKYVK